jgi:hypothetical protein
MTTHRRYTFTYAGAAEGTHDVFREVLAQQCARNWWYNEPAVSGEEDGQLSFTLTVSGEDQWRCHRRAMGLAMTCFEKAGISRASIPNPIWEPLEPHTNRGRYRIPRVPASD